MNKWIFLKPEHGLYLVPPLFNLCPTGDSPAAALSFHRPLLLLRMSTQYRVTFRQPPPVGEMLNYKVL